MSKRFVLLVLFLFVLVVGGIYSYFSPSLFQKNTQQTSQKSLSGDEEKGGITENLHPLSIEYMRQQEYPGSEIVIEQTLPPGSNYDRYIASYKSDGLKIYALLTIPQGDPSTVGSTSSPQGSGQGKPESGWPVIIFNHGYIPPAEYRTTERYIAYTDAFSRNGYVVFRSDYRGHGNSEGNPEGAYYSPAYTIDVLNAVSSIKKLKDPITGEDGIVDTNRMGMWGHSMGGSITLRTMVTTKDIKAGVIWAGVVASYDDLINNWRRPGSVQWVPSQRELSFRRPSRQALIDTYGDTKKNPKFWESIAPISFVSDISGPIQLHHGTLDEDVPLLFSQRLDEALKKAGKTSELYIYEGDDHNIAINVNVALERSVAFFDKYVKSPLQTIEN